MSFFYRQTAGTARAQQDSAQRAPTPLSEVASTRDHASSFDDVLDHEWVLFSPQLSTQSAYDVLSQPVESAPGTALSAASEQPDVNNDVPHMSLDQLERTQDDGFDTPVGNSLELPAHNGSGDFVLDVQKRRDIMERVNNWRLDQSQLVFDELQRLEKKFFPRYGDGTHEELPELDQTSDNHSGPRRHRSRSSWTRITRQFMQSIESIISMDDEVLDFLFGGELPANVQEKTGDHAHSTHSHPQSHSQHGRYSRQGRPGSSGSSHFARARAFGPPGWDDKIVARVFSELGMPQGPTFPLLRNLLLWSLPPAARMDLQRDMQSSVLDSGREYFWGDVADSSSVASTPVF